MKQFLPYIINIIRLFLIAQKKNNKEYGNRNDLTDRLKIK